MNDIVKSKSTSYARYEELLIRRDNLKKEAFILQRTYVAEFGDLLIKVFEKKLDCIRKKKTIEYVQSSVNHGRSVDTDEMQAYLEKEMAAFLEQLDDMVLDTKRAKERETITESELLKIKRIYHKLVKQIHPDINQHTCEDEILTDLWLRVTIAYNCNNLKDMEELEILVGAALDKLGQSAMENKIPDVQTKIARIEAEMDRIRETDPYMYKYLLEDPNAVAEKKQALEEEYDSFEEYAAQLDQVLNALIMKGVSFTWKMN